MLDNPPCHRNGRRLRRQTAAARAPEGQDRPPVRERAEALGLMLGALAQHAKLESETVRDIAAGRVPCVTLPFFQALPALAHTLDTGQDMDGGACHITGGHDWALDPWYDQCQGEVVWRCCRCEAARYDEVSHWGLLSERGTA